MLPNARLSACHAFIDVRQGPNEISRIGRHAPLSCIRRRHAPLLPPSNRVAIIGDVKIRTRAIFGDYPEIPASGELTFFYLEFEPLLEPRYLSQKKHLKENRQLII